MAEMTMRERIARTLMADTEAGMPKFVQQGWDRSTDPAKEAMFRRADAVLAAMREPTAAMLDVGDRGAKVAWCAMIDAALAEQPAKEPA